MRTLYLDLNMGVAGDMLSAALYELFSEEERARFLKELREAGIPDVSIEAEEAVKCGIRGTHFKVMVSGQEEVSEDVKHGHDHYHSHEHDQDEEHHHGHEHHGHDHDEEHHHHHHHHTSMKDIEALVNGLKLSDKVKADVLNVYRIVAEAESKAHGTDASMIHFHELGMMDAVADISAVCLAMDKLNIDKVLASNVCVGYGQVRCQHGIMPVPAPATAYILNGIPSYGGRIEGELCTPTGAALIKYFVSGFGAMPVMNAEKIGYGMGKKDFEAANCVRAMLGESGDLKNNEDSLNSKSGPGHKKVEEVFRDENSVLNGNKAVTQNQTTDRVIGLSCNIDDMTGEEIGFAMDMMYGAGALEVYTVPAGMKKSRPGIVLNVLCREADREAMIKEIFRHTSTIGIREALYTRYILDRNITERDTEFGKVRVKESSGYGVEREKTEFEDLSRIARKQGISLSEARKLIENP